jgi:hypothetical protein
MATGGGVPSGTILAVHLQKCSHNDPVGLGETDNHFSLALVRKDMDVGQHERLSNITLRLKLQQRNHAFIAVQNKINTGRVSSNSVKWRFLLS